MDSYSAYPTVFQAKRLKTNALAKIYPTDKKRMYDASALTREDFEVDRSFAMSGHRLARLASLRRDFSAESSPRLGKARQKDSQGRTARRTASALPAGHETAGSRINRRILTR